MCIQKLNRYSLKVSFLNLGFRFNFYSRLFKPNPTLTHQEFYDIKDQLHTLFLINSKYSQLLF